MERYFIAFCLLIAVGIPFSRSKFGGRGEGCFCPQYVDPVCGIDGKTYGNTCELSCAKVPLAYRGGCVGGGGGGGCFCPQYVDPVCGIDGKTYGNTCELSCANVQFAYRGRCVGGGGGGGGGGCFCIQVYMPVCGVDGRTYGNACMLGCARVGYAYDGECRSGGCDNVRCFVPPCQFASCPNYPSATCVPGCNCTARFIFQGRDVTRQCRRKHY